MFDYIRKHPAQSLRYAMLALYAVALGLWSAAIAAGTGLSVAPAATPLSGWVYILAKLDLWFSAFGLLAALWVVSALAVYAAGSMSRR